MARIKVVFSVLLLASLLSGCGALIGTGVADGGRRGDTRTVEERQMDVRITNRLNAAYVSDPMIQALDIRVSSQRGIVTLQGTVASDSVRNRALRIAESTREVRQVVDRLRVGHAP